MKAMVLEQARQPLVLREIQKPAPGEDEVLVKVTACGVCRTDLHIVDGELEVPHFPIVPGHEIIGYIKEKGEEVTHLNIGQRVGIPWLGSTCMDCHYCQEDRENLCDDAKFTGYHLNGGYAEFTVAKARYCFPVPDLYDDLEAAPLLCAGLIGYRSLKMTKDRHCIGLYGFGAAAHIILQVANYEGRDIYAFTRPGDKKRQEFALDLGAEWAGGSDETPPEKMDAAIIFAPAGHLVPQALKQVNKGGIVVCSGIHMSDIPDFPYSALWGEKRIQSVANLTRQDGVEFLALAPKIPIGTEIEVFPLEAANEALNGLRAGKIQGAAVLKIAEEESY